MKLSKGKRGRRGSREAGRHGGGFRLSPRPLVASPVTQLSSPLLLILHRSKCKLRFYAPPGASERVAPCHRSARQLRRADEQSGGERGAIFLLRSPHWQKKNYR